jgi:hypothetical protein
MGAFSELQQREFAMKNEGFRAVKHQNFVRVGYFDQVQNTIAIDAHGGKSKVTQRVDFHGIHVHDVRGSADVDVCDAAVSGA